MNSLKNISIFSLPSVFSVSDNLSEIELAARDFVNVSVSGKIRLDDIVFPSRFGVGGKALRTELFLICGQNEKVHSVKLKCNEYTIMFGLSMIFMI